MPATATAFRDDWDSQVKVKILEADESRVVCEVVVSKNNTHCKGVQIVISDTEKVRSIIKSKLQKTVNS
eukprot:scaffold28222_cov63-Attheya_sp.AAC.2